MIPKIIHYCWFGGNPKPKLAEKCIKSWKKYCKGYEIIEWSEKNFDVSKAPLYVRQAYEAKKWAFVTDYVRLYAMITYGGIYMDTDVQVVKPLERFLEHKAFSGFENDKDIPTGIMACEKDFPLFKELLYFYDDAKFINDDGTLNMTTNVEIITDMCKKRSFQPNGKFQVVEGFALYPRDYFCPKSLNDGMVKKTDNTYTIHHFGGTWFTKEQEQNRKNRWKKKHRKEKIKRIRSIVKLIGINMLGEKLYKKIRKS